MKKSIVGVLGLAGLMLAGAAFATPVISDFDTADIKVTVEQYCYVRNIDEAKGGNAQFDILIAGNSDLEANNGAGTGMDTDTVVFETYGNFGYELVASLEAPEIRTDRTEDPNSPEDAVTWSIKIDGMSALEDVKTNGADNDVVYAGGPTSQRVTACKIQTVPVQLQLSEVGLKALSTMTATGNAPYTGTLTLTLNSKL